MYPGDGGAIKNLARYSIRTCCSQQSMTDIPEEPKITYQSKARPRLNRGRSTPYLSTVPGKDEDHLPPSEECLPEDLERPRDVCVS